MKLFTGFALYLMLAFSASAQSNEAVKIDEFGSINCEDYLARMDGAIVTASNNPTLKVIVFVYEGKIQTNKYKNDGSLLKVQSVLPEYGLARAKIRSMKKYLTVRGADPKQFTFVSGGPRENFAVELWSVPVGASVPKPTPTISKIRYRKGKPAGFCTGCCGP